MPADLCDRMLKSINYQAAYALGENLGATCVDMAWHMLDTKNVPTATEAKKLRSKGSKRYWIA